MTEALLHFAARRDHLSQTVEPALGRGAWVVCDRFADSTMAYPGYGHGLGRAAVEVLHRLVVGAFRPHLTLVLDLAVAEGLARAQGLGHAGVRFERMVTDLPDRLRARFPPT